MPKTISDPPSEGTAASEPAASEPVKTCEGKDWIKITLRRADGKRKAYSDELMEATLSDGTKQKLKLKSGSKRFSGIPCGTCTFFFPEFYTEIEASIDKNIQAWTAAVP